MVWQAEVAHQIALIPLAALTVLHVRGERRDAAYWWLAIGFTVSWIADVAADLMPPSMRWVPSVVYPMTQAAIVAAVLLPRAEVAFYLATMLAASSVAVVWQGVGPDAGARAVAWVPLVWIVARRQEMPARLRFSLAVYFGLGWLMWAVHVRWLVVATWYQYQLARIVGLVLFARAVNSQPANAA